jgi:hypothetical protein
MSYYSAIERMKCHFAENEWKWNVKWCKSHSESHILHFSSHENLDLKLQTNRQTWKWKGSIWQEKSRKESDEVVNKIKVHCTHEWKCPHGPYYFGH